MNFFRSFLSYARQPFVLLRALVLTALLAWYGFWLATPVVFTTGDLGRHLKNGEMIISSLAGATGQLSGLLHTNFYSSTFADFSFINHHWGTGVIFFAIWSVVGFKGLALFY